ncbi:NADH-quinone oxidoreductase subunit J [Streptomonospora nanhaiensis]|uniref:NADH-quinone oxidoreductase subunit J n=1 Tax=Streptomonospora nanhaiensis TaxID=1323731 RepID=A0A853BPD7_9ACTN|nr:NADH-quinone oxidoreductase subunit J [Streptomonospora nanhaiensis]MBV2361801.1 NADH-quinone oxidoreductase subunit J [Streptomonospora nanhaiensis]MBX9387987.1 NADH-quinone oxidoreductase subunit J [Streptomonospora nanhaiensis]NYI96381.1 NADH-quinone oxidoreductase subunit J [Streptomonospora nanhaiensis]
MPGALAAAAAAPIGGLETAAFYVIGAVVVLGALGVVFSRKAVHSAVLMAMVMLGLAVFYGMNQAPFLMVVQIVVYTGAVLMLFLFVLMLVGVSSADSLVETLRGQRLLTAVVAACFLGALALGLTRITAGDPAGLGAGTAAAGGSVPWIASEVIYRYIIAFEATGALLITAVLGALVLAHVTRLKKRRTQREMARDRIRGDHPTPLPGPGTYARHNAIDMPALLPDGSVSELSLNPVLTARDPALQSEVPKDVRLGVGPRPGGASDSAWSKEGHAAGERAPEEAGSAEAADGTREPGDDDRNGDANGQEAERSWTR